MPLTVPPDPAPGDNILLWARATNRLIRFILPRESRDLYPDCSPGGCKWIMRRQATGGGGAPAETWAFKGYQSPYTGGGDPPDDQPFRVRVTFGTVKGDPIEIPPVNINEELLIPASADHFVYVKSNHRPDGAMESCELDHASAVPEEDPGTPDVAAPNSYCAICLVRTDENGVTGIYPLKKASLNVVVVMKDRACGSITLGYQWTS